MTPLGCQYLIDGITGSIRQAHYLPPLLQEHGERAVVVLCYTCCTKTCIGGHLLTYRRIGYLHIFHTSRAEGICIAFFRIQIVEHIVFGIHILACHLHGIEVVCLINYHIGIDSCCTITHGNHVGSCILRPDGTPVFATHIRILVHATIIVQSDGIVGHQHDSRTRSYCLDGCPGVASCLFYGNHTSAGATVRIDDGIVEVGLHEIVVRRVVCQLPRTHSVSIERIANVHFQMTALVHIHKDVARFIAIIPLHIVLDGLSTEGLVVGISKCQGRTLSLIHVHRKVACLCQTATLPCAIVICLTICQTIGQLLVAAFVFHRLRLHLGEGNEMAVLHT